MTRKAKLLKAIREATYVLTPMAAVEMQVEITKKEAKRIVEHEDHEHDGDNNNLDNWTITRWDDGGIQLYFHEGIAQAEAEWIAEGCEYVTVHLI